MVVDHVVDDVMVHDMVMHDMVHHHVVMGMATAREREERRDQGRGRRDRQAESPNHQVFLPGGRVLRIHSGIPQEIRTNH